MSVPLHRRTVLSAAALAPGLALAPADTKPAAINNVLIAVHGGAGSMPRGSLEPVQEKAYRAALERALRAAAAVLARGGSAFEAVEAAVRVLEDDPNYNAGKGAVFNTDGEQELDACIMNGKDLRSGAVTCVRNTRNPISLARLVMERSAHVMLAGRGADIFALRNGVPYTTQDYFFTQRRWDALIAAKNPSAPQPKIQIGETVGAVAIDSHGELAAATSTGGLTNKLVGRVGDTPIVGAGTYADSRTVAVSCTGTGEVFIRGVAAYDISALMDYAHVAVQDAAARVVTEKIPALGATGGAIALDRRGVLATPHSTKGIINGYLRRDGSVVTRLYDDETPPR